MSRVRRGACRCRRSSTEQVRPSSGSRRRAPGTWAHELEVRIVRSSTAAAASVGTPPAEDCAAGRERRRLHGRSVGAARAAGRAGDHACRRRVDAALGVVSFDSPARRRRSTPRGRSRSRRSSSPYADSCGTAASSRTTRSYRCSRSTPAAAGAGEGPLLRVSRHPAAPAELAAFHDPVSRRPRLRWREQGGAARRRSRRSRLADARRLHRRPRRRRATGAADARAGRRGVARGDPRHPHPPAAAGGDRPGAASRSRTPAFRAHCPLPGAAAPRLARRAAAGVLGARTSTPCSGLSSSTASSSATASRCSTRPSTPTSAVSRAGAHGSTPSTRRSTTPGPSSTTRRRPRSSARCRRAVTSPVSALGSTCLSVCTLRPANQELSWAVGVGLELDAERHGLLNPLGVNCIRPIPGRGIRDRRRAHGQQRPVVAVPERASASCA